MAPAEGEVAPPGYGAFGPAGREKQQPWEQKESR